MQHVTQHVEILCQHVEILSRHFSVALIPFHTYTSSDIFNTPNPHPGVSYYQFSVPIHLALPLAEYIKYCKSVEYYAGFYTKHKNLVLHPGP